MARPMKIDFVSDVSCPWCIIGLRGIDAVPAVVINGRYLISGGQPPEAFEQALRQIAAQAA